MDERIKELIAIGASAAVNCHPCIELHLAACDRLGINRDEVKAAAEVGLMVSKGGCCADSRGKLTALLGLSQEPGGGSGGCGCA